MASPWPFAVQRLVARATGDQGLPAVRYHPLDPQGFVRAARSVQVREPADVMDFAWLLRATELTGLCKETLDHLTPTPTYRLGLVVEGAMPVPAEGYPAKPGDERCVALPACVSHLQYFEGAMWGRHRDPILVEDFRHARAMFIRERLRQGPLHHPVHLPPSMDMKGPQVVVHQAPICRLVWRHDAVIRRLEARCHVGRCAVLHVVRALRADNLDGKLQPERTVATAPVLHTAVCGIRLLGDDRLAEKACRGRARLGEQGCLLCQGELARPVQERLALSFERCGFLAWTTESEPPIVGIPDVP